MIQARQLTRRIACRRAVTRDRPLGVEPGSSAAALGNRAIHHKNLGTVVFDALLSYPAKPRIESSVEPLSLKIEHSDPEAAGDVDDIRDQLGCNSASAVRRINVNAPPSQCSRSGNISISRNLSCAAPMMA
jgi:hypothetical protein